MALFVELAALQYATVILYLAEIACGNFSGHGFVARRQKAWFLPAALEVYAFRPKV
jgi:hypothetical protein